MDYNTYIYIQEAIKSAKSLDEVANLERMLRAGHVPGAQK
jgi:hypothetical protein